MTEHRRTLGPQFPQREGEGGRVGSVSTYPIQMFQLKNFGEEIGKHVPGLCLHFHWVRSSFVSVKTYALANRSSTVKIKFKSQTFAHYLLGSYGFRRGGLFPLKIIGLLIQDGR